MIEDWNWKEFPWLWILIENLREEIKNNFHIITIIPLWLLQLIKKINRKILIFSFISQPKYMLWVLEQTVSLRRFVWVPTAYGLFDES